MLRALPAIAIAAGALALPALASGGVYEVSQCNQALSPTQGQAVSQRTSTAFILAAGCSSGDGLQVGHNPLLSAPSASYGRWVWSAPAGTVFTRIRAAASLVNGPNGELAQLIAVPTGGAAFGFGAAGAAFAPVDQVNGEFSAFRSELACATPAACGIGGGGQAAVRDVLLRTDDRAVPVASFTGGSLFGADAVRGAQTVNFQVADQGGGVRRLELRVNDVLVYDSVRDCQVSGGIATALQPCAASAGGTATLDASAAPFNTGVNQISVCGSDLALEGLPNRACESRDVFVDNLCPESRVGAGSKLSARFGGGKKTATVRSNKNVKVIGALTTDSGDGIGGAKVCALTRVMPLAGQPYTVADTATTRGDGGYRLRLPAGASREVLVDRVANGKAVMSRALKLTARVRPTFEVTPNAKHPIKDGHRLRFRGRLPGPGCDLRVVKIQAKIGKRRWQVFRGVRTDEACVYRSRYKLRSTSRSTRYLFRARVPGQGDYPFAAGSSTVRVREARPARG